VQGKGEEKAYTEFTESTEDTEKRKTRSCRIWETERRGTGEGGAMGEERKRSGGMVEQEELERKTLRLLCSVLLKPVTRVELAGLLDGELFTDVLNRTVFEEIAGIGEVSSTKLRELLPGRITNRGFPDFDLKEFLAPEKATEAEIEKMYESVLKMIEMQHGDGEAVEN